MRTAFTLEHLRNTAAGKKSENLHLFENQVKEKKRQKYNNEIVWFDGYSFRSKRELGRYVTLRALQTAGEIADLQLQVPFSLNDGGNFKCYYVADFLYKDLKTGELVVDDCKGKRTKLFEKKEKLMMKLFGIKIRLT